MVQRGAVVVQKSVDGCRLLYCDIVLVFFLHPPYKNPHPKPSQVLGFGASLLVSSFLFVVSAQDQLVTAHTALGSIGCGNRCQLLDENLPQISHCWVYLSFPSHLW